MPSSAWPRRVAFSAFLVGVAWFLICGGAPYLAPTRHDWFAGDVGFHELGSWFYRLDRWRFPLGVIGNYPDPTGTTTGYSDSIPWMALVAKLARPVIPANWQYFGVWLLLTFGLQGLFAARIVAIFTPSRVVQLLGAGLFVVAPPLLFRVNHIALGSHWVLLAGLELGLTPAPDAPAAARLARRGAVLQFVAAGIHPYLPVMFFSLSVPLLIRLWRDGRMSGAAVLKTIGVYLVLTVAAFFVLGYLNGTVVGAEGFGRYSADLLTLVNPMGFSIFLPNLPVNEGQYEGFAYLGLGTLLLGLTVLATIVLRRLRLGGAGRRFVPIFVVCALLALFAFSNRGTIAGHVVWSFPLGVLMRVAEPLHGSGRFIWPLHYLLLTGAVVGAVALLRAHPRWLVAALAATLLVQIVEQRGWRIHYPPPPRNLNAPEWRLAAGQYDRLVLYPAQLGCCDRAEADRMDPIPFGFLAAELGMTVNSGKLSRVNCSREKAYCATLAEHVAKADLDERAIYIVTASERQRFAQAACGQLDGLDVCVSPSRGTAFRTALASQSGSAR